MRLIFPKSSMVITLFAPAQKVGRASKTPGSVLSRHNLYKWLSFRSAATDEQTLFAQRFGQRAAGALIWIDHVWVHDLWKQLTHMR
jgi:hypothetical protein